MTIEHVLQEKFHTTGHSTHLRVRIKKRTRNPQAKESPH